MKRLQAIREKLKRKGRCLLSGEEAQALGDLLPPLAQAGFLRYREGWWELTAQALPLLEERLALYKTPPASRKEAYQRLGDDKRSAPLLGLEVAARGVGRGREALGLAPAFPEGAYAVFPWEGFLERIRGFPLVLVENLEAFLRYRFGGLRVLGEGEEREHPADFVLVYRGDPRARPLPWGEALRAHPGEVLLAFDLDPAGLAMAAGLAAELPRWGLVVPEGPLRQALYREATAKPEMRERYRRQVGRVDPGRFAREPFASLWEELAQWAVAVPQERYLV
ncbi:hypothetical protein TJA_19380 [Thermus sp. LT1-2-5]|uniref:DUF7281 domain-containing protein n=1 Tax=Thermus sp. LT1-2-5 TaxID=3026935 RepID=UPI0030E7AA51